MSGQERDSQLSAMYDGELPAAECELLARRLARDETLRRQWGSYSLISAVIRGEPLAGRAHGSGREDLAERVRATIARTEEGQAPAGDDPSEEVAPAAFMPSSAHAEVSAGRTPRLPRWAVPVSGVGLAAGVAAAAIVWLWVDTPAPMQIAAVTAPVAVAAAPPEVVLPAPEPAPTAATEKERAASAPQSYTVPPPAEGPAVLLGGASLANFVVAHSEVATPLLRRHVLSALVAAPEARYEEIGPPAAGPSPADRPEGGSR